MKKNKKRPPQRIKKAVYRSRGRPSNIINVKGEKVYELALYHAPVEEMAAHFRVHADTLRKHFLSEIDQGYADGNIGVRRAQYRSARSHSPTMMVHLGKHWLAQRDSGSSRDTYRGAIVDLVEGLQRAGDDVDDDDGSEPPIFSE